MKLKVTDNIMRIIAGALSAAAACASLLLEGHTLTIALAFLLIFFLPGYAMARLVFGKELRTDMFILVSLGLSMLSAILVALALALSPVGLTQESSLAALTALTFGCLAADRIRHGKGSKIEVEFTLPTRDEIDPVIATILAFAVVASGVFAYLIITAEPPSTTHVIMMPESGSSMLPQNGTVNQSIDFRLELFNGEGREALFLVDVYINETMDNNFSTTLEDSETEVFDVSATPYDPGDQRVMAMVYIDGEYYGEVHFWLDILEESP